MPHAYHQTVRLEKGKHVSPTEGACVMELASLLAGEPFTDHPRSVSPLIATFLRMYNDRVDSRRRQDLYAVAASTVGTRASADVEARRAEQLLAWSRALRGPARWLAFIRTLGAGRPAKNQPLTRHEIASIAMHAIGRIDDDVHAATLALVAELVATTETTEDDRSAKCDFGVPKTTASPQQKTTR
ncbi:MAG TPA: hypothetical protein VMB27_07065 [Solirubrobacteraceae bacterium]|nr:hypothetical protein [Solirubrobacteraceae bacterium]